MDLTKRQEKQLNKVFDDPKKLRKWVDEIYYEMQQRCKEETTKLIDEYLNIYSITVAFTAHYNLGLGKKRLPEFMEKIWRNIDCFKSGHLDLQDCIDELTEYGIDFTDILRYPGHGKEKENEKI
jgi:hypothetical protein